MKVINDFKLNYINKNSGTLFTSSTFILDDNFFLAFLTQKIIIEKHLLGLPC